MSLFKIGSLRIQRVEEMLTPGFDPAFLFPSYDPQVLADHPILAGANFFHAETGRTMSSMQSWLLRIGNEIIVIDTGCGNDKVRESPAFRRFHMLNLPYLERLAECGVRPDEVTMVINTHLHVDHVGWNTRLVDGRWVPTFPNARYLMGRQEVAHWHDPAGGPRMQPEGVSTIVDSVDPIIEAGKVELIAAGDTILPGLTVEAVPGHTPGQLAIRAEAEGQAALFTADVFHQPMQVYRTDWNSRFCEMPEVAIATRRRVFAEAAGQGTVLFPSHPGFPHAGRITTRPGGFDFAPVFPDAA